MKSEIESAEVVVIGSGPGGAVTAATLAEGGRDVIIIEEGPDLPPDSCEPFSASEMERKYRSGGLTPAFGKPKVAYVEGCCVGGGSEINSGLYHRAPDFILEEWAREYGLAESSPAEMLPHFQSIESDLSVRTMPGSPPPASQRLDRGAAGLGWKSIEVPRWFEYDCSGGSVNNEGGRRKTMTRSFIPRAIKAGARLYAGCKAVRLARRSGWMTVKCIEEKAGVRRWRTFAARDVFVCGGAVQTAALLRRSGIRRNVGNSLQMHPTIKAAAQFPDVVNAVGMGVPVHQVKEFSPLISLGCSISSKAHLAMALFDHPGIAPDIELNWTRMAVYYGMITPFGRGSVRKLPGFESPLVRFAPDARDMSNLAVALGHLARCLLAGGATAVFPSVAGLGPFRCVDDLSKIPAVLPADRTNLMTIHLFSTCPMGENKERCGTDSFGAVRGHRNIFIADGSLLCAAPGVNPQGTIMAFARRNALRFLGGGKR